MGSPLLNRRGFLAGGVSVGALMATAPASALSPQMVPILLTARPGAVLPAGARGVWYADQYQASPRRLIPNAQSATAVSANLFAAPRRLFAKVGLWDQFGITVTDLAATAPDGSSDATTLACIGNWGLFCNSAALIPAGTYTVAINAKRNAGSDQSFCFSKDFTSTRSAVQTATSAWQRFAYTFTLAGPVAFNSSVLLCSIDGSTAADLQICDYELFAGSSDLGPSLLAGHLTLGQNHFATEPTYASGALDLSNAGWGVVQFPTAVTYTTFTTMALASKVAAGSSYQAFLSKVTDWAAFTGFLEQGAAPMSITGDVLQFAGLWTFLNRGYHVFTHRFDGTTHDIFIDNIKMYSRVAAFAAVSLADLFVGVVNVTSLTTGHKVSAIALYDSALSDAQVRTAVSALQARAATSAITASNVPRTYVAEGDSITAAAVSFAFTFPPNASPAVVGRCFGVSGSGISTLLTRAASVDAIVPASRSGQKFILSVLIGAADLVTYAGGAAQYLIDLAAYCDARRAAGWLVVVCTILAVSGSATHNSRRATVNAAITGGWLNVHCDGIADFAADATMGTDTSFTDNPTKWTDGIHPSAAGHVILETIIRPVINGL